METPRISVIIPLYNKEREVLQAVRSVVAQRFQPVEILVMDDGSTDLSCRLVEEEARREPLIRLLRQPNAGVSAARNRAVEAAAGDYVAFLDADDTWEPDFLAEVVAMIREWPDCGLYSTGFYAVGKDGRFQAPCPDQRGVVENFFRDSAHKYIAIPSTVCIPRRVYEETGGFPEGMKIGEDLYLWIKIASHHAVCFSPKPLVNYSKVASNRSSAIYKPEQTRYSFEELYDAQAPVEQNEFLARAALGKALVLSTRGATEEAARAARFFAYTKTYRRTLRKVVWLNRLPRSWRPAIMSVYDALAWRLARKGL